jgi:hypothetical protein
VAAQRRKEEAEEASGQTGGTKYLIWPLLLLLHQALHGPDLIFGPGLI